MTVMVKDQETLPRHNSGVLRNSVQSCKALYLHLKEEEKVNHEFVKQ